MSKKGKGGKVIKLPENKIGRLGKLSAVEKPDIEKRIPINLLIGTPAYNGMVHIDYLNSIMEYHREGIPITTMTIGNESLITRGRNTVISYFNKLEQFTHLLFLDADMFLSADNLIKLISHEKDVIGAPVALKGFDAKGNPVYNTGEILGEEGPLVKVDRVGTAVFMLSRAAVNSLVNEAIENGKVYGSNPHTRGMAANLPMYDIFEVGVFDGEYLSEDYVVCKKLQKLGYDVYVDPTVKNKHNGMYVFGE